MFRGPAGTDPASDPVIPLRERFRREVATAIAAAAEEIFAEEGVHSAHVGHIAKRAGVAVGTLYNYFEDRDALLAALLRERGEELVATFSSAVASVEGQPLSTQLTAFVDAYFAFFELHRPYFKILFEGELSQIHGTYPRSAAIPVHYHHAVFGMLEDLFRGAAVAGELRAERVALYPWLLLGMLRGVAVADLRKGRPHPVSVTFGTLMGAIDASIVNVAVPKLRGAVGATVEEITWISTGFALATVLVMPLTAFLGRLFGQKRVYLACLALFVAGSALCGMARSLTALVAFRVVQGFGAGALQPTEQAILRQTFPPEEQGMAMALFGMAVMIGPAIGPTLGGFIVDNYTWPWIFYINVPVGALGIFMVTHFVHEPDDIREANRSAAVRQRKHMDWAGIAWLSVGLSALQYALEEGNKNDWFASPLIDGCLFVGFVGLALFVVRELTATVPAVDIGLFRDPVFLSGTLIGAVMFAMLMSLTFLLPLFMEEILGFTATQAGLALMPRTLVMMAMMPVVGRLYNKVPPRLFVALGVVCFCTSAYMMSHYTLDTDPRGIIAALAVQGVGFSCLWVPLTTVALSSIPRHKLADATGSNSLLRQIGGSVGLALFATLLTRAQDGARSGLVAHIDPGRPEVQARLAMMQRSMAGGAEAGRQMALRAVDFVVSRQAAVLAFEKMFLLAGILFLVVMPLLMFLKVPQQAGAGPKPDAHVEL